MKVLALEPYYGGSHKAFLDGWSVRSRHQWTVLGLPARKWKWRMRQAALSFAWEVKRRADNGESWELVFCSDMLNLAEFSGLAPKAIGALPSVAYFHENQLTYPVRHAKARDYQFGLTNITTALAADAVWFNSEYHRRSFLQAIDGFVNRMPDHRPRGAVSRIEAKSSVHPPGIDEVAARTQPRVTGPVRILWVARWEFDKAPEIFFEALRILRRRDIALRVSVLGEGFGRVPKVFELAREELRDCVERWGYAKNRGDYEAALAEADVVVSTARHEFFGLGILEAVAAGAHPLLPSKLSYPELLASGDDHAGQSFFYRGGARALATRLETLAAAVASDNLWGGDPARGHQIAARFFWSRRVPGLDQALEALAPAGG